MTVALVYENRFSFEDSKLLLDPEGGEGGGGVLGLIFGRYVLLGSQSPYPIIVYSVANY